MPKPKMVYICSQCQHQEPKWLGRCPECGKWNTFTLQELVKKTSSAKRKTATSVPLSALEKVEDLRFDSGLSEINRVLGGGIMKGSTVLLGGEPGIGKSTLMLQLAASIKTKGRVLYISGEESPGQLKMRAQRLNISSEHIEILAETELSSILCTLEHIKPVLIIVDSIQTLHSPDIGPIPGSVNQIKYISHELGDWAKTHTAALFLVGHVTKEGIIAGPKVIEHMVDTVLSFDIAQSDIRILRANKNRFGSIDEIGLFRMTERGLLQVQDPSSMFLEKRQGAFPPGVVVTPVYEGSRVLLIEIQSLVVPAKGGISRVFSDRIDARVVSKAAAVLEKHLNLQFTNLDIYINVAGGIQLKEVGIELPLCLSLYSARFNTPLPAQLVAVGEVSLAGEIRPIAHLDKRLKTARDLGFFRLIAPKNAQNQENSPPMDYKTVTTVKQAVQNLFIKKSTE